MTTTTISMSTMGDSFDCQICFEFYEISGKRQPCVVDCGHTLCCECVTRLKSLRGAARCPFCKTAISSRREFPKNYSLLDAMSSYHASVASSSSSSCLPSSSTAAEKDEISPSPTELESLKSASNEVSESLSRLSNFLIIIPLPSLPPSSKSAKREKTHRKDSPGIQRRENHL
jgi:hypothetical protein